VVGGRRPFPIAVMLRHGIHGRIRRVVRTEVAVGRENEKKGKGSPENMRLQWRHLE
jgi:hypothetical protein